MFCSCWLEKLKKQKNDRWNKQVQFFQLHWTLNSEPKLPKTLLSFFQHLTSLYIQTLMPKLLHITLTFHSLYISSVLSYNSWLSFQLTEICLFFCSKTMNHLFDLPEKICYVQCGICTTILLVSLFFSFVPTTKLFTHLTYVYYLWFWL